MNSKVMVAVVAVVVVAAGFLLLSTNKSSQMPATSTKEQTPTAVMSPAASPSSAMETKATEITVSGSEFMFDPATITAKKGETLKITFKNVGKYPHNFTIADLNVSTKTIQPGESDIVTFTADKAGTFGYMCTVDSHADKGMKGTLTVQ